MEGQAFSPSSDLAPPLPPLSTVSKSSLFLNLPVRRWSSLYWHERRDRNGGGAKSYDVDPKSIGEKKH
jgi:hypothetical protein